MGPGRCGIWRSSPETHEDALYRLLRTLASMGVFAEEKGRSFRLTPSAACAPQRRAGLTASGGGGRSARNGCGGHGARCCTAVQTGEDRRSTRCTEPRRGTGFADHPAAARLFDRQMDELTSAEAISGGGRRSISPDVPHRGRCRGRPRHPARRDPQAEPFGARHPVRSPAVVDSARRVLDADVAPRVDLVAGSFSSRYLPAAISTS